jgi:hypothetical protein
VRKKKFADAVKTFRLPESDLNQLQTISTALELAQSEIIRRAVRIGLSELQRAHLPGGRPAGAQKSQ